MTETSLAAVAVEPRRTVLQEIPVPQTPPDGGLLRILSTGVCGSDWPMYLTREPGPRILGHEMVGVVDRIGRIAKDRWGVQEGDVIALEEYLPCGHCDYCRSGEFRSCAVTDSRVPGTIRYGSTALEVAPSLWGGFSQYAYLHPRSVIHRVPEGVPAHIASMAIPIGNGFQWAYLDGQAGPGKVVVVQGPGPTGLACAMAAKLAGADLVIVSGLAKDSARFDVARRLGADVTVAVDEKDLREEVSKLTGGRMADVVLEVSSAPPEIFNSSLRLLRKRGMLLLASRKGKPPADFNLDLMMGMQITIKGLRGHSFESVEMALDTMKRGVMPLELLSTHTVGLDGVDEALRMIGGEAPGGAIHINVTPWKN